MEMSPYQRVADALLHALHGTTLPIFVLDLHDQGESTRAIASRLRDATDGAVDVSNQTIKDWLGKFAHSEAAA